MMCLSDVFTGNEKKEALAKLPKSGYYWKSIKRRKDGYYPLLFSLPDRKPFKRGWNRTGRKHIGKGYNVAFHLHRTKKDTKSWVGTPVRCKVEKKDIVAIGTQFGLLTIITTRFWMPKPS